MTDRPDAGAHETDRIDITVGVEPGTLDSVREILAEYAELPHNVGRQHGTGEELAGLPAPYVPPHGDILTARSDGGLVGCVVLARLEEDTCEMKRLYVRDVARGRGLGRRLVEAVLRRAVELGYHRMRLDTAPELGAARALYDSMGFRRIEPYHDRYADPICFEFDLISA